MFPAPTKEEIAQKIYKNDVMVLEAYTVEEMKFYHSLDIVSCAHVKLLKGKYTQLPERSRAKYVFSTHINSIKAVPTTEDASINPSLVDR
jgi:hypothetical protein